MQQSDIHQFLNEFYHLLSLYCNLILVNPSAPNVRVRDDQKPRVRLCDFLEPFVARPTRF